MISIQEKLGTVFATGILLFGAAATAAGVTEDALLPAAVEWLGEETVAGISKGRLLLAISVLMAAGAVHFLLRRLLKRVTSQIRAGEVKSEKGEPAGIWNRLAPALRAALAPLAVGVWFYGFYLAVNVAFFDHREHQTLALQVSDWIARAGLFLLFLWLLFRLIDLFDSRIRLWAARSERLWDSVLATVAGRALRLLVPLIAVILGLPLLPSGDELSLFFRNLVSIFIILGVAWMLYEVVRAFETAVTDRFRVDVADNLRARKLHTQVTVLRKVAVVVIAIFAMASILMVFDSMRQFGTSILASAGIAGIIIGFAAQRSLGTLFAGFQIAITQPIRLDDVVIVEGEWGRIEEITLTYVVVRIWDLRRLVLPIHYFIETPFQNWTRTSADILGTVFLHTDYTVPVEALRLELDRILENHPKWDGRVKGVQVTESRTQTLEVRLLMSAADASLAWDLRCDVREKMIDFIRREYPESLPRFRAEFKEPPRREGLLPRPHAADPI